MVSTASVSDNRPPVSLTQLMTLLWLIPVQRSICLAGDAITVHWLSKFVWHPRNLHAHYRFGQTGDCIAYIDRTVLRKDVHF